MKIPVEARADVMTKPGIGRAVMGSALAMAMALAGCVDGGRSPEVREAVAQLRTPQGKVVGSATLTEETGRILIVVEAEGLAPGLHGIHIHETGRCTPSNFENAGDHLNPLGRGHGLANPAGAHAGDLPNLEADSSGRARYSAATDRLTLATGPTSVFDGDGSAIVVHAKADDQRSDPAGASGDRILCGEIVPRPSRSAPRAEGGRPIQ